MVDNSRENSDGANKRMEEPCAAQTANAGSVGSVAGVVNGASRLAVAGKALRKIAFEECDEADVAQEALHALGFLSMTCDCVEPDCHLDHPIGASDSSPRGTSVTEGWGSPSERQPERESPPTRGSAGANPAPTNDRSGARDTDDLRAQRDYYRRRWIVHGLRYPAWMFKREKYVEAVAAEFAFARKRDGDGN